METTIPFHGFYNSVHDSNLDYQLESTFQDSYGNSFGTLTQKAFEACNWHEVHFGYSKRFTEHFANRFGLAIKFVRMSSPKYYNFETDRIHCSIELAEVERLYNAVDKEKLAAKVKARFTSYGGFISFYPNDLKKWPKSLADWDCNHIETLIQVYIESHDEYDKDYELSIAEHLSESAYSLISAAIEDKRIWKLLNYLDERSQRKAA